jgi:hypothetical protein
MTIDKTAPTLYSDCASEHPVLKDLSPKPYCPHLQERRMNCCSTVDSSGSEAPVLAHLCLDSNEASDIPMMSSVRPSDHPVLLRSPAPLLPIIRRIYKMDCRFIRWCQLQFCLLHSVPSTPTLAYRVASVHPTMSFLFLSFLILMFFFNLAYVIFASLGPRNVYKDMLNNMISPIDHVVMNHQNHTRNYGI